MERVDPTSELGRILVWCSGQKATDLHTQSDRRYSIREHGKLRRIAPEQFPVAGNDDVMRMLHQANNWRRVEMDMHGFAPSSSPTQCGERVKPILCIFWNS
jgi:hypothetical protein